MDTAEYRFITDQGTMKVQAKGTEVDRIKENSFNAKTSERTRKHYEIFKSTGATVDEGTATCGDEESVETRSRCDDGELGCDAKFEGM